MFALACGIVAIASAVTLAWVVAVAIVWVATRIPVATTIGMDALHEEEVRG